MDLSVGSTTAGDAILALSAASTAVSRDVEAVSSTGVSGGRRRRRLMDAHNLANSIVGATDLVGQATVAASLPGEVASVVQSSNIGIHVTRSTAEDAGTQPTARLAGANVDAGSLIPAQVGGSSIDTSVAAYRHAFSAGGAACPSVVECVEYNDRLARRTAHVI